ncbi:ABC transporter permease subunit [Halomarina pelagica]|uniref:ABC transporter permease subunit n=1 Tax=Halomarina pelagica TaxID=2961599 RepID=UPI0020C1EA4A|nr:ABC transporter permease subunit [Halomarina sp. BND7]
MSVRALARYRALDPYRSTELHVTAGLLALVFGLAGYQYGGIEGAPLASALRIGAYLVPLLAVMRYSDAVAGDRATGRLRGLLALPVSRRAVVLATAVGRAASLAAAVCVGVLAATLAYSVRGGVPAIAPTVAAAFSVLVLCLCYTGIVVGVSAASATTTRAFAANVALWLLVQLFWGTVPRAVAYAGRGFTGPMSRPDWAPVFESLSPIRAFQVIFDATTGVRAVTPTAIHETPWFAALVLLAWTVAALAVGLARFDRATL